MRIKVFGKRISLFEKQHLLDLFLETLDMPEEKARKKIKEYWKKNPR